MSFATRHNRHKFDIDTTGFPYMSLHDLYTFNGADHVYPVRAVYINSRSKFGAAPLVATDENFVNLPSHMCQNIENILANAEDIELINSGKVGFTIYTYESHGRLCYGINWTDITG